MGFHLSHWDYLLIAAVSVQVALMAYLPHPRWKAFVLSLPLPFTLASLSLGRPVDATNVLGFALFLGYAHGVRILYRRCRLPIAGAIALSALGYAAAGMILARAVPAGGAAFWLAMAAVLAAALITHRLFVPGEEPGHRTSLPVWIKLPIIVAVVSALVLGKQYLKGFMTVFPMVGLVGAYEARHSLGSLCRQVPLLMAGMMPMLAIMRLAQGGLLESRLPPQAALLISLGLGWIAYLLVLVPVERHLWRRRYRVE